MKINVVGAGLAGCEASYQLAKAGFEVHLYEMRPKKTSEAHKTPYFAELVCSNSLRSDALNNAIGVLKEELRILDSLIMRVADETKVPSGSSLSVDRESFAKKITEHIKNNPNIHVIHDEVEHLLEGPTIIATGPLTSEPLAKEIIQFVEADSFYFYDAAAPIIEKDSIDFNKAYFKSRYSDNEKDYINCPMNKDEFFHFYHELIGAKTITLKEFEKEIFFEGCMPFEEIARRGFKTLLFGPMKPVGLEDENGKRPYAVVQLRQDNAIASLYNIVGFQTHLSFPEQKRILQMIPGLENCNIVRYGVMHRNTYLNAPMVLKDTYQSKKRDDLFFAGQMTGVEGYIESCASGLLAALNMAYYMKQLPCLSLTADTVLGSMIQYITHASAKNFQPMNANFGICSFDPTWPKNTKKQQYAEKALSLTKQLKEKLDDELFR
ncbi:MAG: methylenetetrahydrofolate--tRNA-(uracil(54)-C(5))-methyltransferase (FADH(2)-oxidizing) TrmFO [Erysipelotrichaceae bacterium]